MSDVDCEDNDEEKMERMMVRKLWVRIVGKDNDDGEDNGDGEDDEEFCSPGGTTNRLGSPILST